VPGPAPVLVPIKIRLGLALGTGSGAGNKNSRQLGFLFGEGRIRTFEGISRLIYSQMHLATLLPLQKKSKSLVTIAEMYKPSDLSAEGGHLAALLLLRVYFWSVTLINSRPWPDFKNFSLFVASLLVLYSSLYTSCQGRLPFVYLARPKLCCSILCSRFPVLPT
jgi:hypothetical protein